MKKKLRMALSKTKFSNSDMVAVAAKPDEESVGDGPIGISSLVAELSRYDLELHGGPTEFYYRNLGLFSVERKIYIVVGL